MVLWAMRSNARGALALRDDKSFRGQQRTQREKGTRITPRETSATDPAQPSLTGACLETRNGIELVHDGAMAAAVQVQLSRAHVRHLCILYGRPDVCEPGPFQQG